MAWLTHDYILGGRAFIRWSTRIAIILGEVKIDDGHCEFTCTVCLDDDDVAEWMMMGIEIVKTAVCFEDKDVLCSTG